MKPIVTKDFVWDVSYNVGWNHNEITELEAGKSDWVKTGDKISRENNTTVQANKVGAPINSFFVLQQVYDENGKPIEGLYVDRDGNGIIDDGDRYCYKSPALMSSWVSPPSSSTRTGTSVQPSMHLSATMCTTIS